MASYTTAAAIGGYLGITLTPEQVTQADAVAAAATAFIDRYTGRSWQAVSPVVAEWLPIIARKLDGAEIVTPTVYLLHRPAVAVSGVVLRASAPGVPTTTLLSTDYELTDGENGVLRLLLTAVWQGRAVAAGFPYADPLVALVDYTWAAAPPADIALAATTIGATEMARLIALGSSESFLQEHPELAGLKSVAVGQNDVNVALSEPTSFGIGTGASDGWAAPGSAVEQILRNYRQVVIAWAPPVKLPMDWLRSVAEAFLPDTASIARYTESSTSDGVSVDWVTIASGIPCRVSPRAATALEGLGPAGAAERALSHWFVVVPAGTDVTERDRVTIVGGDRPDGRTFEILRVGERSYEASRELICDLVT